jgi:hypothetical protein
MIANCALEITVSAEEKFDGPRELEKLLDPWSMIEPGISGKS